MAYPHYDARFGGSLRRGLLRRHAATLQAFVAANGDLSHGERRLLTALARVRPMTPQVRQADADDQAIMSTSSCRYGNSVATLVLRTHPERRATFGGYLTAHDPPPSPSARHARRARSALAR